MKAFKHITLGVSLLAIFCAGAWADNKPFLSDTEITKLDIAHTIAPTPVLDGATDQQDVAIFWANRSLIATQVGLEAAKDDVYLPADVWPRFASAVQLPETVAPEKLQHLFTLIERAQQDGSNFVRPFKQNLPAGRTRPFVRFAGSPTCLEPIDLVAGHRETDYHYGLKESGSYPSSHSVTGMLWGMTLAELVPEFSNQALERGITFGQSRVVCGFHFQSDVQAGRMAARTLFEALHKNKEFLKELAAAKKELNALRN